jgi:hypothetical protein
LNVFLVASYTSERALGSQFFAAWIAHRDNRSGDPNCGANCFVSKGRIASNKRCWVTLGCCVINEYQLGPPMNLKGRL